MDNIGYIRHRTKTNKANNILVTQKTIKSIVFPTFLGH
jgi:hypothetical protein